MLRVGAATRQQLQSCPLLGRGSLNIKASKASLSSNTSTRDELLELFKQSFDKSPPAASPPSAQSPAQRGVPLPQHWAAEVAKQIEFQKPPPTGVWAKKLTHQVANVAPLPWESKYPKGKQRGRKEGGSQNFDFSRDWGQSAESRRKRKDMSFDDNTQDFNFKSTDEELSDEAFWSVVATTMNKAAERYTSLFDEHITEQDLDKAIKTKRVRRQKYQMFLKRCVARRLALRANKKPQVWQWPEQRDLVYNTDLFVPLNLELKGIPEEGDDLPTLLQKQMEDAARAIGHNPSWPLGYKRKFMLDLKTLFEQAVRKGPHQYDLFAQNHFDQEGDSDRRSSIDSDEYEAEQEE